MLCSNLILEDRSQRGVSFQLAIVAYASSLRFLHDRVMASRMLTPLLSWNKALILDRIETGFQLPQSPTQSPILGYRAGQQKADRSSETNIAGPMR